MQESPTRFAHLTRLKIANRFPFLIPHKRGSIHHYLLAIALMALALWARLAIAPVNAGLQYVTFFPAVTLAAVAGGLRPGLFATALGLVFATYIFTPPYYSISFEVLHTSFWSNMVFLMDGIIVSFAIETMHRYRQRYAQKLEASTEAHAELEEGTQHLKSILDNLFAYVALLDTDGVIQEVNKAPLERSGFRREDVIGQHFQDAPWWSYDDKVRAQLIEAIKAAGQGQTLRYDVVVKMGNDLVPIDFQISPVRDEAGKVVALLPTAVDITERKKVETALRDSENKFHLLFESANDCMLLLSTDGRIMDISRSGHERLGYTKEEMLGRRISEFDPPEFADKVVERVAKIMRDGHATFESAHVRKNGSRMPIEINSMLLEMNGEKMLFSVIRDITKRKAAENAVLKSEANLRAMMDNSPYLTWLKDAKGRYITINKAFASYLRLKSPAQAAGKTDLDLQPKELAEKYRADDAEVMASRQQKHVEESSFDGKNIHWVETFKTPIIDERGKLLGTVGFASDITERKRVEAELRIASVAFDSQEGIMITDANKIILRVNKAFTETTGYSAEELVGQTPRLLKSGHHDGTFYVAMWEAIHRTGSWQGEIWDRRKNGETYPKWLTITAIKDADGIITNYVGTHTDISERKLAEEEIRSLAFYDPLTQLPNRRLLIDRLQQALASSARSGREGALMFIDLDNFKTLNDTLGHDKGDMLLQQVAQRLTSCVREDDTVARLGGDEFVVMLEDLPGLALEAAEQAEVVGEKILASLNQLYQLGAHEYLSTPSIGVILFHGHKQPTDELMKQADIAMYQAKKAGRNTLRFFDPQMQETINARVALESELRKALENKQLHLYYQIQVDNSHRPLGAEALVRWPHPKRGLVSPAQFIPLAEETGLILPLGQWVLETACAQLKLWEQYALTRELVLSVNVSAKQFRLPDFAAQVLAAVQRHAINPELLKLELTESMLHENIESTITTMNALREIGIHFSLDDFGTGYSSLQYLKRLPLDQLKIDYSFVRDIATDGSDRAIVGTIIAMAHGLNLNVIAEGVETEIQREFLLRMDCTHYQGYLFGKPVPIEQFEASLRLATRHE